MSTDYKTECGSVPLSFIQMLASAIVGYHDLAGLLHYRINTLQAPDNCSELTDPTDCDLQHIDPERWIVENTFSLDDCSYLAWRVFSNGDNDWDDYSECGEVPKTLIELVARCIYTYSSENKINAVIDSGACTEVTALLGCSTNNIESERLLVSNIFAVDDCGNMLIKFFSNSSTMTDYTTGCVEEPQTFYQLLARCIVEYEGHYYLNVASVSPDCTDLHDFWTCSNNHIDPERALVENVFATDDCGNLALKIANNQGDRQ